MSITVSTAEQICNSPTNLSKSKMLYSFPCSKRFQDGHSQSEKKCKKQKETKQGTGNRQSKVIAKNSQEKDKQNIIKNGSLYLKGEKNLQKYTRSTMFGYGRKFDFTKQIIKTPAPGQYENLSLFCEGKKKGKGFCFGGGRQQMEVTGPLKKNGNPGPGTYQAGASRNSIYYSLIGKNKVENKELSLVPGPGTYQSFTSFNKTGSVFLSRFKNKSACKFSRQQKLKPDQLKTPGPNAYNLSKTQLSPQGRYFYSRLKSAKGAIFGKGLRLQTESRCKTPGPGNYRVPSQFGYYISKYAKYTKEKEKEQIKNKTISYDV